MSDASRPEFPERRKGESEAIRAYNIAVEALAQLVEAACDGNSFALQKLKITADHLMDAAVRCLPVRAQK